MDRNFLQHKERLQGLYRFLSVAKSLPATSKTRIPPCEELTALVLVALANTEDRWLTVGEFSKRMRKSQAAGSRLVSSFVTAGTLRIETLGTDRRHSVLHLTNDGRKLALRMLRAFSNVFKEQSNTGAK